MNRGQLRNPTLGNRVWATFTIFIARVLGSVRLWLRSAWNDATAPIEIKHRSTTVESSPREGHETSGAGDGVGSPPMSRG